jgi:Spy/CpxP family protein refolding chaperone
MRSGIMKPRNVAIALALAVSLLFTSYAQSAAAKAREQRLMGIAKQLHLTRQQEKQLIPIMRAEEPQLEAIRNDPSLSRTERLQRLQAVHDQANPQVKAILTPQQYHQLQDIRQKRRAQLMQATKSKAGE